MQHHTTHKKTKSPVTDGSAFSAFELAGWQQKKIVSSYNDYFGKLTSQAVEPLLDASHVRRGMHVLDIASGPGYATATANRRGARVIGIDFSSSMIEQAQENFPDLTFIHGDAEHLPFVDESFDAVIMNFGILHMARPEQALNEIYRVLRPGKFVSFSVWAPLHEAIGFKLILDAVEKCGSMNVPLPPAPPFFRFSDGKESTRTMQEVGFTNVKVEKVDQTWDLEAPEELAIAVERSAVRTGGLLKLQTPEALAKIHEEVAKQAQKYVTGGHLKLSMPAIITSGQKPL